MAMRNAFQELTDIPAFSTLLSEEWGHTADHLSVLQLNIGYLCNLACKHCHVEGGPHRTEIMARNVMDACLRYAREQQIETIDITGGAPEMNPDFKYLVEQAVRIAPHVIVRTNLVILTEPGYEDFIDFFKAHKVEVVCSLPYYRPKEMNRVRGDSSFERSIEALTRLNQAGYGRQEDLVLNLVYNPAGAFFPPEQSAMEREYKAALQKDFGIVFHHLFTLTNNPIGRFGQFLIRSGNLPSYMNSLYQAFNPGTLGGLMCRFQLSVRYDGKLYDCDFNQAEDLPILTGETIFDLVGKPYKKRRICVDKHCYGCTAGQGSSCGGATE